eukprot:CAMPEP_0178389044 /NCGR_PEP_ID=MMETSP0689_2-20121128/9906_1 /TAXON_ID=160604 /ORGANISM="Amphidinium massartii, Strain CS-259" /LENGTH=779 /DNA_ID=CAMNT_0020009467 /DNA_START=17 /DNA_END=2356 /DNA_ORIENTATION=+
MGCCSSSIKRSQVAPGPLDDPAKQNNSKKSGKKNSNNNEAFTKVENGHVAGKQPAAVAIGKPSSSNKKDQAANNAGSDDKPELINEAPIEADTQARPVVQESPFAPDQPAEQSAEAPKSPAQEPSSSSAAPPKSPAKEEPSSSASAASAVAAPKSPAKEPSSAAATAASSPAKGSSSEAPKSAPEPAAAQKEIAADAGEPKATSTDSSAAPAKAAAEGASGLPPVELVPIQMFVEDMEPLFQAYTQRVSSSLAQTLDCTWERIQAEIEKAKRLTDLEWYWLAAGGDAGKNHTDIAKSAIGLVVFRVVRGAMANHGQVCHLSIVGEEWRLLLEPLLAKVKETMFRTCPVGSLRISLWYSYNEEGAYKLDAGTETTLKATGWRWFQLTNTADGKRGQIMVCRRNPEVDPPEPRQVMDLSLSSCLIMGYTKSKEILAPLGVKASHSSSGVANASVHGNPLVMAECLRRHALAQGADTQSGAAEANKSEQKAGGDTVDSLLKQLSRRPTTKLVFTKDTADSQDCQQFAEKCTVNSDGAGQNWITSAGDLLQADSARRAFCGGLALSLDWKESWAVPKDPEHVRVAVHARGSVPASSSSAKVEPEETTVAPDSAASGANSSPPEASTLPSEVLYLATEDDDIFVIVWQLPDDLGSDCGQDALYKHCRTVVKSMPPTSVTETGNSLGVELPRLAVCTAPTCSLPQSAEAAQIIEAKELVAVNLAVRPERLSILKSKNSDVEAGREVIHFKSAFVFCVWHTSLDELEVPMFVSVVEPSAREADQGS